MQQPSARILIVDDDEHDRFLVAEAFREAIGPHGQLHTAADGEEAIRYLRGEGAYSNRSTYPFPTLILLDLKMPHADGFAVLQFMAHNPAWSVVPRVVLTSSNDEDDIKKAYLVGASAYHWKPNKLQDLRQTIQAIVDYWRICEVPPVDVNGRLLMTESRGRLGERIPQPKGGESMERLE